LAAAAEVDAFVPNQGAAAPGTTVPAIPEAPRVPVDGQRGRGAYGASAGESEFETLKVGRRRLTG